MCVCACVCVCVCVCTRTSAYLHVHIEAFYLPTYVHSYSTASKFHHQLSFTTFSSSSHMYVNVKGNTAIINATWEDGG